MHHLEGHANTHARIRKDIDKTHGDGLNACMRMGMGMSMGMGMGMGVGMFSGAHLFDNRLPRAVLEGAPRLQPHASRPQPCGTCPMHIPCIHHAYIRTCVGGAGHTEGTRP